MCGSSSGLGCTRHGGQCTHGRALAGGFRCPPSCLQGLASLEDLGCRRHFLAFTVCRLLLPKNQVGGLKLLFSEHMVLNL